MSVKRPVLKTTHALHTHGMGPHKEHLLTCATSEPMDSGYHVEEANHISGKKLNIMVADLSDQAPIPFNTLFINGRRAVRARYPDGNPETMGLHTNPTGYVSKADRWLPPENKGDATEIHH